MLLEFGNHQGDLIYNCMNSKDNAFLKTMNLDGPILNLLN